MSSKKKRRANKKNAQQSTGPASPAGMEISSKNAATSGVFSDNPILMSWETPENWDRFHAELMEDLAPETGIEACLAERIIRDIWRILRADVYEARIDRECTQVTEIINNREKLSRQEQRLDKRVERNMERLMQLQMGRMQLEAEEEAENASNPYDHLTAEEKARIAAQHQRDHARYQQAKQRAEHPEHFGQPTPKDMAILKTEEILDLLEKYKDMVSTQNGHLPGHPTPGNGSLGSFSTNENPADAPLGQKT